MTETVKKGLVILDVDGVLNPYSNRRFYFQFMRKSLTTLARLNGIKRPLQTLKEFKKTGINGLFVFAKKYCGSDEKFEKYKKELIKELNFDLIPNDPAMKKMLENLGKHCDICIRSDGLDDIASAIWKRIINNQSSANIKIEAMRDKDKKPKTVYLHKTPIIISGIEDNDFNLKKDIKSWEAFSDKYDVDITKSILIDDSRNNTNTASLLGMKSIHISKLDSLLKDSQIGSIYNHSLTDVLGKITKNLKRLKISYGKHVDLSKLLGDLLTKDSENETKNNLQRQTQKLR